MGVAGPSFEAGS